MEVSVLDLIFAVVTLASVTFFTIRFIRSSHESVRDKSSRSED